MLNSSLQRPTPYEQLQHTGQFPYKSPPPSQLSFTHSSTAYAFRHFDCANEHNTPSSPQIHIPSYCMMRSSWCACPSETQRETGPSEGQQCLPDTLPYSCLQQLRENQKVLYLVNADYSSDICETVAVLAWEKCITLKLKFSALSDVDGKERGSRVCLNHKKIKHQLLVQLHVLNKDNGLKFSFCLSVQSFYFSQAAPCWESVLLWDQLQQVTEVKWST